jgi:lipopolysaccharide/colanic/teichoic acid biosynthesis glycosyltransferase
MSHPCLARKSSRIGGGAIFARRSWTGAPAKRAFDVAFAVCALAAASPLILLGMAVVRVTTSGPALYRARRAGQGGRPFDLLKLRTMRVGADASARRITGENDDRVTPVGGMLRRLSIDELPQLWNVLRGELSIVGPRPEDWQIVQRFYTAEDRRVLAVRPGLVSPSTVRWYPDIIFHDPPAPGIAPQDHYVRRHLPVQVAEATEYAATASFLGDLRVIAETIHCILVRSWRPLSRRPLPHLKSAGGSGLQ